MKISYHLFGYFLIYIQLCSVLKLLTGGKYKKNARQFND